MTVKDADARLQLVSDLTAAVGREIDRLDPLASMPWTDLPDVRSMVVHIGSVQRWVTAVVRSRRPVDETIASVSVGCTREWYEEGRRALLEALAAAPVAERCWIIGQEHGTVGFWHRRMVYEHAKHLMDLRTAGGAPWTAAAELSAADYADGIDELLSVFLPRSRPGLAPLPNALVLHATDFGSSWRIDRRWHVAAGAGLPPNGHATRITARASDLALALWERADLHDRERFRVDGDPAAVEVLSSTRIHPW